MDVNIIFLNGNLKKEIYADQLESSLVEKKETHDVKAQEINIWA